MLFDMIWASHDIITNKLGRCLENLHWTPRMGRCFAPQETASDYFWGTHHDSWLRKFLCSFDFETWPVPNPDWKASLVLKPHGIRIKWTYPKNQSSWPAIRRELPKQTPHFVSLQWDTRLVPNTSTSASWFKNNSYVYGHVYIHRNINTYSSIYIITAINILHDFQTYKHSNPTGPSSVPKASALQIQSLRLGRQSSRGRLHLCDCQSAKLFDNVF